MNRTFIVERDVLVQVWQKQRFEIEAEDKTSAINLLRRTPKEEVYDKFSNVIIETLLETEIELSSQINIDNCYEIPVQKKLDL